MIIKFFIDFSTFWKVFKEELRQDKKWGAGRIMPSTDFLADYGFPRETVIKEETDFAIRFKRVTWDHILLEELTEVHNSSRWSYRRKELIQLAAVIFQEIKSNDKRWRELRDEYDPKTIISEDK